MTRHLRRITIARKNSLLATLLLGLTAVRHLLLWYVTQRAQLTRLQGLESRTSTMSCRKPAPIKERLEPPMVTPPIFKKDTNITLSPKPEVIIIDRVNSDIRVSALNE